ncbi:hypothetical protein CY34DRAFT_799471 [Suillus luteus UH-Slu-Lm8-n1]|uniref:Uncharacterized protein n=1 Tax=Suillus luteus UH-Slu-Lm8-n1 TaxID=930992 RepID=A0A0D0BNC0_9AGAM|nr:hypothetical protein CY34DRAFT_799471 [Suillus luteus UH-Slu-Lm8-n1]
MPRIRDTSTRIIFVANVGPWPGLTGVTAYSGRPQSPERHDRCVVLTWTKPTVQTTERIW